MDLQSFAEWSTIGTDSYSNISAINSYPTHHKCSSDTAYVNLYICKNNDTHDTLLVFEACKPLPPYLDSNSTHRNTLSLAKDDIKKTHPKVVYVDLPGQIKLPLNAKYVFGELKILAE